MIEMVLWAKQKMLNNISWNQLALGHLYVESVLNSFETRLL